VIDIIVRPVTVTVWGDVPVAGVEGNDDCDSEPGRRRHAKLMVTGAVGWCGQSEREGAEVPVSEVTGKLWWLNRQGVFRPVAKV